MELKGKRMEYQMVMRNEMDFRIRLSDLKDMDSSAGAANYLVAAVSAEMAATVTLNQNTIFFF